MFLSSRNYRPGHAQHTYFLLSDNAIQNLPSKHYDYTISYGANSTKYDNYEIHNFDTRLCEVNGEFYGFFSYVLLSSLYFNNAPLLAEELLCYNSKDIVY